MCFTSSSYVYVCIATMLAAVKINMNSIVPYWHCCFRKDQQEFNAQCLLILTTPSSCIKLAKSPKGHIRETCKCTISQEKNAKHSPTFKF